MRCPRRHHHLGNHLVGLAQRGGPPPTAAITATVAVHYHITEEQKVVLLNYRLVALGRSRRHM